METAQELLVVLDAGKESDGEGGTGDFGRFGLLEYLEGFFVHGLRGGREIGEELFEQAEGEFESSHDVGTALDVGEKLDEVGGGGVFGDFDE